MKLFRKELKNLIKEVVNKHLEKYNIVNCGIYFSFRDDFEDDLLIDFKHEKLKCELDVWETYFDLEIYFSYSKKKLVIVTLNAHSTVTVEGTYEECDEQYYEYIQECEKHGRVKSLIKEINKALKCCQFLDLTYYDFLYYDEKHKKLLLYNYPKMGYLEIRRGVVEDVYILQFIKRDMWKDLKGLRLSFSKIDLENLKKLTIEEYQKVKDEFLEGNNFKDSKLDCKEIPPKVYDELVKEVKLHGGEMSYE